jgi:hypothetical protein
MRYFLDTEFNERGPKYPIELISIALVCEDGQYYYAVSTDFNPRHAGQWVKDNVLLHLPERHPEPPPWGSPRVWGESRQWKPNREIAGDILAFVGDDPAPEFWGYYCDYDWVVFCQLFGDMSQKPAGFPYYCRDLQQAIEEEDWGVMHSGPKQPDDAPHNALSDARWIRETFLRYFVASPQGSARQ